MVWAGRLLSGLVALFLMADGIVKLMPLAVVTDTLRELGYPDSVGFARLLGVITLGGACLYAWPRSTYLGAILLTGLMGAGMSAHVRLDHPLFTHTLFAIYLSVALWGGLWLRDERLRALVSLSRPVPRSARQARAAGTVSTTAAG